MLKSKRPTWLAYFLIFILFVATVIFVNFKSIARHFSKRNISSIDEITHITNISYPISSKLTYASFNKGLSPYLLASFKMPQSGIKKFISQFPSSSLTNSKSDMVSDSRILLDTHWELAKIHHFSAINAWMLPPSKGIAYISIFIDLDDSKEQNVYVLWRN